MLLSEKLKELAVKNQTTELNVRREYVQHLFLSYFYRQPHTDGVYFKGGTALRLVFSSPRFSEDLDFSASLYNKKEIENAIVNTLKEIEREGIQTEIIESKETTGGYLGHIRFILGHESVSILLQFSKRSPHDTKEVVMISSDFIPPYTITLLDRIHLINEKIHALLTRAKPRDFYDLYFLIRTGLMQKNDKDLLVQAKMKLEKTTINFDAELKRFLPKSYWPIIHHFPNNLERELGRFI